MTGSWQELILIAARFLSGGELFHGKEEERMQKNI